MPCEDFTFDGRTSLRCGRQTGRVLGLNATQTALRMIQCQHFPGLFMNSRRMVSSCCSLSFNPKPGTDRRLVRRRFGRSVRSLTRNTHASGLRLNDLRLNRCYS